MQFLKIIRWYLSLFGLPGLLLAVRGRNLNQLPEITVTPPGVRHPVCLRLRSSDMAVFRQVFVTGEYDCRLAKPPSVIVDAGANIGLTSVYYASRYPQARIIAIEPELSNFELLVKNAVAFRNVIPVWAALWNEDREISVVDPGRGCYGFQTAADEIPPAARRVAKVPGLTMNKLMRDHAIGHIDILKVDIEGSEKELFENASSWIGCVGVIAIELHDRIRDGCSASFYAAASGLTHEFHRGETTFLMRREYVAGNAAAVAPLSAPSMSGLVAGNPASPAASGKQPNLGQVLQRGRRSAVVSKH